MDGNGRWAEQRGLPRIAGHQKGIENAHRVIDALLEERIEYVTSYVFSTENWNRPREEVDGILRMLGERIAAETEYARQKGLQLRHLGRLEGLPAPLVEQIERAIAATKGNQRMVFCLAFNYGSRSEIVDAVQRMMADGLSGGQVDEQSLARRLYTAGMPDVDLVIRTGGELRLSNFLLWQSAYAELYFTPVLWPDFGPDEIRAAVEEYRRRQRRFGSVASPH
jgi:undecaprenyl diphosphate synthase